RRAAVGRQGQSLSPSRQRTEDAAPVLPRQAGEDAAARRHERDQDEDRAVRADEQGVLLLRAGWLRRLEARRKSRATAGRGYDGPKLAHRRQAAGAGEGMRSATFVLAALAAVSFSTRAQQCPDVAPYQKARDTIADLDRIVTPNGIQESYKTKIGGIDQWINVRGQDQATPIILFVHGGPDSPLIPTLWQFQRPLEEYFTVVNYDQRGAGKTYVEDHSDTVAASLHIPRYIDDEIEIAEHVRKRYGKSKVILMAHSWGTVIGLGAALKRPDLFYAYVGIGQVISTRDNERISFDYGLQQAKARGNTAAVKEMESIAPYPGDQTITRERIIIARKWAQFYGGLTAFREESSYFFNAPLLSPEYSAADVCAVDQGNVFTLGRVLPEFLNVDYKGVRSLSIPVFMFMGRHDYTTPAQPTADWLDKVSAPAKQGVWFERSSHMIPWEEPGKVLLSLVQYVRPLAEPTGNRH